MKVANSLALWLSLVTFGLWRHSVRGPSVVCLSFVCSLTLLHPGQRFELFGNILHRLIAQRLGQFASKFWAKVPTGTMGSLTHSLTAALDQLRVVESSTSNDPGPRSRQHQQIGQCLLPIAAANFSVDASRRALPVSSGRSAGVGFY